MTDLEYYTKVREFLDDNMQAFIHWSTDIGALNEIGMETNKRLKLAKGEIDE